MKLSQLALSLPSITPGAAGGDRVRASLGPRRVAQAAGLEADSSYALQELLNSVQALAQGAFHGEAQVHEAAAALAADLEKLGPEAGRLLRPLAHPLQLDSSAGLDLEA